MEQEVRARIKALLEEGERDDDVRRALISEGLNTEGFAEVYQELTDELGIEKKTPQPPTPSVPHPEPNPVRRAEKEVYSQNAMRVQRSNALSNTFKVLIGSFVLVFAIIMLSGIGPRIWESLFGDFTVSHSTQSPVDIDRESNLRTMQISAQAYRGKLLDYGGLCRSIGVDNKTYHCTENTETYAIEAQLSDGSYFCVDSTGFAGVRYTSYGKVPQCTQE